MVEPQTRFVVKRLNWAEHYNGGRTRKPGEVALQSFATFDEADAECAKREKEVRANLNPFECGASVQYWSHLDEPRLRDWLMDHGIDPPAPDSAGAANWKDWWKKSEKKFTPEKRAVVWEALDKVRFFAVRAEPVRPVGYAVIAINWEYNDENFTADEEGGVLQQVYRARANAEATCARLNDEAREEWGFVEDMGEFDDEFDDEDDRMAAFDMQDRLRCQRGMSADAKLKRGEGLFNAVAEVPFYEVIEVELEGLE